MSAFLLTAFLLASTTPFDATFDRATAAYNGGDFAAAIDGYEQLVAERVYSPVIFFNLGNAYYRAGRIGPAIANYERTLQLDPNFVDAQKNLDHCLDKTKRRLARPLPPEWEQSLLFWHYGLTSGVTRVLAIVMWLAFWGVLAVRCWRRLPYLKLAALCLGVLAVAFGASAWAKAHPEQLAVACAERVPVYYTTSESGTVRFELYEGDRVEVLDRRGDEWLRVRTIDGEQGWTPGRYVALAAPPYPRAPEPSEPPATTAAASEGSAS